MEQTLNNGRREHAVVLGGSVAGLLAAKVLLKHFARVTVVERDRLSIDEPTFRKGVSQAHHQHVLVARGRQIVEQYFPGFDRQLAELGAPLADYTADFVLRLPHGRLPRFRSGVELRLCRRMCIDHVLLSQLVLCKGLQILDGTSVTGFVERGGAVAGVSLRGREAPLLADLVVDATGRGSRTPRWLERLGYQAPREQVINPHVAYATRLYEKPEGMELGFRAAEVASVPLENPRAAGLWEIEDGVLLLTLIGTAKHHPPTDEAGYNEFARKLADPIVIDTIERCRPLSDIRAYRNGANCWRHYEKLRRFPAGLLVMADAYAHFNPLYGHGMTSAALQAQTLDAALEAWSKQGCDAHRLRRIFYRRAQPVVRWLWLLNTVEDLRWPTTTGAQNSAIAKMMHTYIDQLMPLTTDSPKVVRAMVRVANLLDGPQALAHPRLLAQLVRAGGSRQPRQWLARLRASRSAAPVRT